MLSLIHICYVPSAENNDTLAGAGETGEDGKLTFGKLMRIETSDGPQSWRENGTVLTEHYYILVETKAPDGYRLPAKKMCIRDRCRRIWFCNSSTCNYGMCNDESM